MISSVLCARIQLECSLDAAVEKLDGDEDDDEDGDGSSVCNA